jgi:hypothetical protein
LVEALDYPAGVHFSSNGACFTLSGRLDMTQELGCDILEWVVIVDASALAVPENINSIACNFGTWTCPAYLNDSGCGITNSGICYAKYYPVGEGTNTFELHIRNNWDPRLQTETGVGFGRLTFQISGVLSESPNAPAPIPVLPPV